MASVLSAASWYDYTIHNIFNVANFIDYDQYPAKRRKLDNSSCYPGSTASENSPEYELVQRDSSSLVRNHQVIYRPYISDIQQNSSIKHKSVKKNCKKREHDVLRSQAVVGDEEEKEGTSIDSLYPELLCLIFEKLDLQSKGRVAQVSKYFHRQSTNILPKAPTKQQHTDPALDRIACTDSSIFLSVDIEKHIWFHPPASHSVMFASV